MKKNTTKLRLPFNGDWFVVWGGDTKDLNQHHNVSNQKYAFDFVILGTDGLSYNNAKENNNDYYAFGKKVVAPAKGIVVNVINNIPDNIPGETNEIVISGNVVMIEHENNEISVLAHLKQGSIEVKLGDEIKTGQVIGECGNSGNSTEPHVHYHLQKGRDIYSGEGIKCFFKDISVENKGIIEKYSPVMDDIVSNHEEI